MARLAMIEFVPSPRESARFGLRVGRAAVQPNATFDTEELHSALRREPLDVAILRMPEETVATAMAVDQCDFQPIRADTLVRYDIDLHAHATSSRADSDITLREASAADARLLETLAREIFAGYVTHYHANPLFAPDKILDGYAEWAASFAGPGETSGAWFVERGTEIVGFSGYRIDAHDCAVGVLNGILPAARGRGSYRAMLRRMLDHFASLRLRRFSIATQHHNVGVQHTWRTEGMTLRDVSATVHFNRQVAIGDARGMPGRESHSPRLRNG